MERMRQEGKEDGMIWVDETVLNCSIVKDIHHNIVAGDIVDSNLLSALQ